MQVHPQLEVNGKCVCVWPIFAHRDRFTSTLAARFFAFRASRRPIPVPSTTYHTTTTQSPEWMTKLMPSWAQDVVWPAIFAMLFGLVVLRDFASLFRTKSIAKSLPAQPQPSRKRVQFLDLPGEIRNLIYEFAITERNGLQYVEKQMNYNGKQVKVGHLINRPARCSLICRSCAHCQSASMGEPPSAPRNLPP
jgi:hypothetical protein